MNYKDLSQFYLKDSILAVLDNYEIEENQYDQLKWQQLLQNLIENKEDDKFNDNDLKILVEYLLSYSCNDALKTLIESEVPTFLFTYIIYYVQQNMIRTEGDPPFTPEEVKKISKNKQIERCLFLINEIFKAHDLFDYEKVTADMLNSYFIIYEFSESLSSDISLSIITRYAEHSNENLHLINTEPFNYQKVIMKKLKRKQKMSYIYAFFPFLKDESMYMNSDNKSIPIIEFLMHIQTKHSEDYEIFIPIVQFYNIYMNHSDKSIEKAVSLQALELIMSALKTETYKDIESISLLKQTATDMYVLILNSKYDEYKSRIVNFENILFFIENLLSRKSQYNCLAASQILFSLIINEILNFSDESLSDSDYADELLKIIELLHECLNDSTFNVKSIIFKIFAALLKTGKDLLISNICKDDVLDEIIYSIENFDDETQIFIMKSLYHVFQNFEECLNYVSVEEAIETFSNVSESSSNLDVSCLSQSIADFLSQQ